MFAIGIPTMERNNRNQYYVPEKYIQAVRHAGGLPILIPPGSASAERYIALVDGLLLMGGGDVIPSRYGEPNKNLSHQLNEERDESEFSLLQHAVSKKIPVLGVCRGMQLINVFFGGTLYQDLAECDVQQHIHGTMESGFVQHSVTAIEGTRLADIFGHAPVMVKSMHHQCVSRVGEGLVASAFSSDGVIEGIEMPVYSWLVGVQWHPEQRDTDETAHQGLFNHFLMACEQAKACPK